MKHEQPFGIPFCSEKELGSCRVEPYGRFGSCETEIVVTNQTIT